VAKLEHSTLNERVYRRIRDSVTSGAVPPSTRLDEQSLATEMGVSRTPVREAIGKLTKEGLVEYRPYQGNFVRAFNARQVNDLYEVRKALELLAVRLAVPRLTPDDLAALGAILDDVQEARERGDMATYSAADRCFHAAVAIASGNETLVESLDRLGLQIQLVRTAANHDPAVVNRTAHQRPGILAAMEAGDAERAAALMAEHIEGVRRAVIAHLAGADDDDSGATCATGAIGAIEKATTGGGNA